MKSYHLKWSSHLPNMGLVFRWGQHLHTTWHALTWSLAWPRLVCVQHICTVLTVSSTLYQSEGLSDVCLACEDGSVRAHKLLLSTCSDFFLVSIVLV